MFLQVRAISRQRIEETITTLFRALDEDVVQTLATYAVAGADGLFVHHEVSGDRVDLVAMFELHARLVHEAAVRMAARSEG
ncbi:hypothetical protein AQJ67_16745 [Streptomyces caeruleatus]|uniref:TetR family transcriptional regulator n=1 Tax=Streptomyces caeruleatus TaxID=661399 RepID=A0A124I9R6_9ACTN|nr:hypothetical protein AQJ67_16745 [Streptomyces caeruleatus]